MKLKERNNSFGMAIEIHRRITASGVHSFLLKIHKYVARSRHQLIRRPTILIASLQDADFIYYSFKNVSISCKKSMRLVYHVISCDGLRGSILALGIVRWLPAYPKFMWHAVP